MKKKTGRTAARGTAQEGERFEIILETAARLFATEGYTRTSLDAVAQAVGIHKATLYHYFDSKEEILEICLTRASGELELAMRHLSDGCEPAVDRLRYFFNSFVVAQAGLYGRCIEEVAWESLRLAPSALVRAFNQRLEMAVGKVLEDGIRDGEVREGDPQAMARTIFGAFQWLQRWYRPAQSVSLGDISRAFVGFAAEGIAGPAFEGVPAFEAQAADTDTGPEKRREEIVRLATRCFTDKGYDAASIGDIAQAVGLQKASLYHYFPGKAAILSACMELAHGDIEPMFDTVTDKSRPFSERFFGFLHRMMLAQNSEYGVFVYMVRDQQLDPETLEWVSKFRRDLRVTLRTLIEEGRDCGVLRDIDPALASAYILGVTNGVPRWYDAERDGPIEQVIDRVLQQLALGFLAKHG